MRAREKEKKKCLEGSKSQNKEVLVAKTNIVKLFLSKAAG